MHIESDQYIASKLTVELVQDGGRTIARQTISEPRTWFSRAYNREEDWQRGRPLGKGSGGSVYLETCVKGISNKGLRAVKTVEKGRIDYRREIEAAMLFSHPKVLRCP